MKLYKKQFLGIEDQQPDFENAQFTILPFPYEGGVSYGKGTGKAPDAILDASCYLELYDEVLDTEPHKAGIVTIIPPNVGKTPEEMFKSIYTNTKQLVLHNKFVVLVGGDHSISSGYFNVLKEKYPDLGAVQLDAHSDLRDEYKGSKLSHASVMARIRDKTTDTLQIGIRSMCLEEAEKVKRGKIALCTMDAFRKGTFDVDKAIDNLPEHIFITVDVDGFDWSVVRSTGTPEPGGFLWDEALALLRKIFERKTVVGFDVVELSYNPTDPNSPFAVAKLIYKMIGYKVFCQK